MRRQQHVKVPCRDQLFDKGQKPRRIAPQSRAAVKLADEARIAREAPRRGIADLDVMARESQHRDRLEARGGGTFGNEYFERFCGNGHGGDHHRVACFCRRS